MVAPDKRGRHKMLEQVFILALPIILMVVALAFDSPVFAFFGGVAATFMGLSLLDTIWAAMIFIGLGIYFILISVLADWGE